MRMGSCFPSIFIICRKSLAYPATASSPPPVGDLSCQSKWPITILYPTLGTFGTTYKNRLFFILFIINVHTPSNSVVFYSVLFIHHTSFPSSAFLVKLLILHQFLILLLLNILLILFSSAFLLFLILISFSSCFFCIPFSLTSSSFLLILICTWLPPHPTSSASPSHTNFFCFPPHFTSSYLILISSASLLILPSSVSAHSYFFTSLLILPLLYLLLILISSAFLLILQYFFCLSFSFSSLLLSYSSNYTY